MESKKLTILGIDPGIADTGYGLITMDGNNIIHLAHGSIKTHKTLTLPERLEELEKELIIIIDKYQPNISGVEELFFCNNAKTAFVVGQARGVVLLTLKKSLIPIKEFTPLQVKQGVTGYGKADKRQVQQMVKTILNLDQIPRPDDAADALAVAICSANTNPFNEYK
jgi:crossover junction endodeoxyribonuclease RuvC